jgi:hypothetical protein
MNHVVLTPDFFRNERNNYGDWASRIWGEFCQNSSDAAATSIFISVQELPDRTRVTVADDGLGMTREILERVYFSLGQTTKKGLGTTGGFGRARIVTTFSMMRYAIRTNGLSVEGSGGNYEISEDPEIGSGCEVEIDIDKEDESYSSLMAKLHGYLRKSNLPCRVYVNGNLWSEWAYKGEEARRLRKDDEEFATVHVSKNATISHRVLVRVNGALMYDFYTRAKALVIVEIDRKKSLDVLTSNRDHMRSGYSDAMESFVEELAVDTESAVRPKRIESKTTVPGRGMIVSQRKKNDPEMRAVKLTALDEEDARRQTIRVSERVGPGGIYPQFVLPDGRELSGAALLSTPKLVEEVDRDPESDLGKPIVPNLPFILVEVDTTSAALAQAAGSYDPRTWVKKKGPKGMYSKGALYYKLLMLWKVACEAAVEAVLELDKDSDGRFSSGCCWSVGWTFSDNIDARLYDGPESDGYIFLLNPVDAQGKMRFGVRDKNDHQRLMALAMHEAVHLRHRYHDEEAMGLLTEIMAVYDLKGTSAKMRGILERI